MSPFFSPFFSFTLSNSFLALEPYTNINSYDCSKPNQDIRK